MSTTAVKITNLVKDYDNVKAVNQLNLSVPKGAIYGFLGPNGAGKTTTLKMIVGMTEPTDGEIEIFGNKLTFGSDQFRDEIGFLPDVPGFYDFMTAKEYLTFAGTLYHIPKDELQSRVKVLLKKVGLEKSRNKKVGGFSRGMKQRLGIAQALINNPKIIILDEPVSALDPVGRKEVIDIIGSLAGDVTVFFSSHILADVERICDHVIIIKEGKNLMEDSVENIKAMSKSRRIELEFDTDTIEDFKSMVKDADWIEDISSENKKVFLEVRDLDTARKHINEIICQKQIMMKKYIVVEPTLEDIFIKVVNGNA